MQSVVVFFTIIIIVNVAFALQCSRILQQSLGRTVTSRLKMMDIQEFGDDETDGASEESTEEQRGLSHGYEGDFKVGDSVRVKESIRIWSVKKYMKEGFDVKGFHGKVHSLALYGRKYKTLCSAITPIKVEFEPDSPGIPPGMFDKKFIAHFSKDEIERIDS